MGDVLLVSGGLGMGHEATAQTCAASLAARGWSSHTVDAMRLLGRRGGAIGEAVFRGTFAVPGLYDAFHFAGLRPGSRLALWTDAAARRRLVPKLRAQLDAHPADLVISVFSTGASAVSALAPEYPGMRHIVFCTDATPHRLWVHRGVDLYLVTSRVAECAVRRFQPGARVIVMPPPVRPGFYDPPTRQRARAELDIPEQARCVLLMSGGWGLGPVAEAAAGLADAGLHVLAVAGRNTTLAAALRAVQQRKPLVHAFGFTDRVPELMAAADLVITSSGDTCTEARTVGRRLLLLDVVPGHGRDNLQHELELGDAEVTSPDSAAVVAHALAALREPVVVPAAAGVTASGRAARDGSAGAAEGARVTVGGRHMADDAAEGTRGVGPGVDMEVSAVRSGVPWVGPRRDGDGGRRPNVAGGTVGVGGGSPGPRRWEAALSAALAAVGLPDRPRRGGRAEPDGRAADAGPRRPLRS